jgi:hypothetical protein
VRRQELTDTKLIEHRLNKNYFSNQNENISAQICHISLSPERKVVEKNNYRNITVEYRRKLHNEELHDLYSSPSIIRVIKARRMKWAGM